jgi:hypothetical protein
MSQVLDHHQRPVAQYIKQIVRVNDADDVIPAAMIHRKPLVSLFYENCQEFLLPGVRADRDNLLVRHHHFFQAGIPEFENAVQHLSLFVGKHPLFLAHLYHQAQFLFGYQGGTPGRRDTHKFEDHCADVAEEDYYRIE